MRPGFEPLKFLPVASMYRTVSNFSGTRTAGPIVPLAVVPGLEKIELPLVWAPLVFATGTLYQCSGLANGPGSVDAAGSDAYQTAPIFSSASI